MNEYLKYINTEEMKLIMDVAKMLPNKGFTYVREEKKVGRNELCKCESGKKYKKCCGV